MHKSIAISAATAAILNTNAVKNIESNLPMVGNFVDLTEIGLGVGAMLMLKGDGNAELKSVAAGFIISGAVKFAQRFA